MKLQTSSFIPDEPIPPGFAFCDFDAQDHVKLAPNKNPAFSWSDAPTGTESFVLLCHDPDVPSEGTDVNQEGREVPADLRRVDFFHWVLTDIPGTQSSIEEGEFSSEVTARGKSGPGAAHGTRQGVNNYTEWFAGDADMKGDYYGYDGPCPPWNDSLLHHYHFTLYALDVEKCPIDGRFTGFDVRDAIAGHVLAEASVVGTYTLNPALR